MLTKISIENFAIIDKLSLNLSEGLNIFTGETGAGKSIIIEALGFVLGERGDSGLIKEGAQKMTVEAAFNSAALSDALRAKYQITGQLFILKREMDARAKNHAWINGKNAPLAALADIGGDLVDFHGQHEHQALFKPAQHLAILDAFAQTQRELAKYTEIFTQKAALENKIAAAKMSREEKERMLSLYEYQLGEIEKAAIKPDEDAEIEAVLPKLKNAGKLKEYAEQAHALLSGMDGAAAELLAKADRLLEDMAQQDAQLAQSSNELKNALTVVEDISAGLASYSEDIDIDPAALDDILGRQEVLRKIKQKYGPGLADVFATEQKLKADINNLQSNEENLSRLHKELEIIHNKLIEAADILSAKRQAAAKKLAKLVVQEIAPLGFGAVRFEADIQKAQVLGPRGQDEVEFLFSSNAGQSLKPLRNIASGGEASRLMLGLKTVLAGGTPVMVFDEIDTGISGHTGKLVGAKLKQVSLGRQVLCVTHLAQAAVYGDAHYCVTKTQARGRTSVNVCEVKDVKKVEEIARMIGSSNDAASAGFNHAKELLKEAGSNF